MIALILQGLNHLSKWEVMFLAGRRCTGKEKEKIWKNTGVGN